MENASKALIMAAEVLIGLIIISIGVAIFNMFQAYSRDTVEQINEAQIAEFNNNFLKYYGKASYEDAENVPIRVSIHDIISLANFAKQNNEKYDTTNEYSGNLNSIKDTLYVRVCISKGPEGLEKWTEEECNNYMKNNDLIYYMEGSEKKSKPKYYYLKDYKISETTKKVYYVLFEEYK